MICTNCGCVCSDTARFCVFCGTRVSKPEPPAQSGSVTLPLPAESTPIPPIPEASAADTFAQPSPAPGSAPTEPESAPLSQEPAPEIPQPTVQDPAAFPVYQSSPYQHPPGNTAPSRRGPAKKGTHWIPIAIMAVLTVIGLGLFLALPFSSATQAPPDDSGTPWFYNDNGTLYFYEEYYNGPRELTVPDMVDGQPVTALAPYCFAESRLTTVILPNTLQTIGNNAFAHCEYLRGIFIPEGVTLIGAEAFYYCSALEAICIPASTKTIDADAFYGCLKLQHIFYNGIHSHWLDLYEDMIGARTQVYCTDGTFGQHYNNR